MEMTNYIGGQTPVTVVFDYTPEEKPIYYPNDQAHPGCPEELEITAVLIGKDDIADDLSKDTLQAFEEQALEWVHDQQQAAEEELAEWRYEDRKARQMAARSCYDCAPASGGTTCYP